MNALAGFIAGHQAAHPPAAAWLLGLQPAAAGQAAGAWPEEDLQEPQQLPRLELTRPRQHPALQVGGGGWGLTQALSQAQHLPVQAHLKQRCWRAAQHKVQHPLLTYALPPLPDPPLLQVMRPDRQPRREAPLH